MRGIHLAALLTFLILVYAENNVTIITESYLRDGLIQVKSSTTTPGKHMSIILIIVCGQYETSCDDSGSLCISSSLL